MRVAVKFAYDGTSFHGYQRQPNLRTVENEIIRCLQKANIVDDVRKSGFKSGSRTDKGVSAVGNVLAFDTEFSLDDVIPAHNAYSRDVWFHSIAEVDDSFNPRIAKCRWYRYHMRENIDLGDVKRVAAVFVGEHDFKLFSRSSGNTFRVIDSIDVEHEGHFTILDIKGRSFLWQMIRRIVSAVEMCVEGRIDLGSLKKALAGMDLTVGVAPPEPLFLMDVDYDVDFKCDDKSLADVKGYSKSMLARLQFREEFYQHLASLGKTSK